MSSPWISFHSVSPWTGSVGFSCRYLPATRSLMSLGSLPLSALYWSIARRICQRFSRSTVSCACLTLLSYVGTATEIRMIIMNIAIISSSSEKPFCSRLPITILFSIQGLALRCRTDVEDVDLVPAVGVDILVRRTQLPFLFTGHRVDGHLPQVFLYDLFILVDLGRLLLALIYAAAASQVGSAGLDANTFDEQLERRRIAVEIVGLE